MVQVEALIEFSFKSSRGNNLFFRKLYFLKSRLKFYIYL